MPITAGTRLGPYTIHGPLGAGGTWPPETLAVHLRRGRSSLQEVIRFGSQIAGPLAEADAKGITHRDLEPGNIMIAKSGVKVLDLALRSLNSIRVGRPPMR